MLVTKTLNLPMPNENRLLTCQTKIINCITFYCMPGFFFFLLKLELPVPLILADDGQVSAGYSGISKEN